jgi:hypothetical protein
MGKAGRKHLEIAEMISNNQVGDSYGPSRLVYNIYSAGGTTLGGEKYGSRNYKVDLEKVECSCNIPQLYHAPCSHVITACTYRGIDHEDHKFMSPFYLMSNTLKVWECSFEPYLDPTQWPPYLGLDYVLDPDRRAVLVSWTGFFPTWGSNTVQEPSSFPIGVQFQSHGLGQVGRTEPSIQIEFRQYLSTIGEILPITCLPLLKTNTNQ